MDLSTHRSVWLTRTMVEAASLLIGFDEVNRAAMLDRYPDLQAPMVLLSDLLDGQDIADPVDGGLAEFQRCYQRIAEGSANLAGLLR